MPSNAEERRKIPAGRHGRPGWDPSDPGIPDIRRIGAERKGSMEKKKIERKEADENADE